MVYTFNIGLLIAFMANIAVSASIVKVKALKIAESKSDNPIYSGRLVPIKEVNQIAPFNGKIIKKLVGEGQKVKARQSILSLSRSSLGQEYGKYFVKSNISGVVNRIKFREGEEFKNGTVLVSIIDTNRLLLKLSLSDKDYFKVDSDQSVKIIDPGSKKNIDGKIYYRSLTPDPESDLFSLEIEISGLFHFKPGMFVQADFFADLQKNTEIPKNSVFGLPENPYVFSIDRKTMSVRKIDVEVENGSKGLILIKKGLSPGQEIVIHSEAPLQNGAKIELIKPKEKRKHP